MLLLTLSLVVLVGSIITVWKNRPVVDRQFFSEVMIEVRATTVRYKPMALVVRALRKTDDQHCYLCHAKLDQWKHYPLRVHGVMCCIDCAWLHLQ